MTDVAAVGGLHGSPPDRETCVALAAYLGLSVNGNDRPDDPLLLPRSSDGIALAQRSHDCDSTARWLIAADVRLDGREELVGSLGLDSSEAAGIADVQLVARAFERWGETAPEHLLGGFAIIAWDRANRRLHLVADSSAERMLYFHLDSRRVIAATRAPLLLAAPGVPRAIDVPSLIRYFTDLRELWRTPLAGIEAVPPGYAAVIHADGRCERRRWWHPPPARAWIDRPVAEPLACFQEVFRTTVADNLRCCTAAGGFCSGGLDSTAVTAVAADLLAPQGRTFRTYTSVPHPDWRRQTPSPRIDDEGPFVRLLARRHSNIAPTFVAVNGAIFLDFLPRIFARSASPVRNTSNVAWYMAIAELMRADGVLTPLTGAMGNAAISLNSDILVDLLAAGRLDLLAAEWRAGPRAFRAAVRRAVIHLLPESVKRRLGRGGDPPGTQWRKRVALRPAVAAAHDLRRQEAARVVNSISLATWKKLFRDMFESAVKLRPVDAYVQEVDPSADPRVIALCWSLPPTEFRHGADNRWLIRRAMAGLVPDEIRLRRNRGAQAPDVEMHLGRRLDDLRDAVEFIARDALCSELIDLPMLRRWLDEWPADDAAPGLRASYPHERALSMGLYIRWINDGLTSLPGTRLPPSPIVQRG